MQYTLVGNGDHRIVAALVRIQQNLYQVGRQEGCIAGAQHQPAVVAFILEVLKRGVQARQWPAIIRQQVRNDRQTETLKIRGFTFTAEQQRVEMCLQAVRDVSEQGPAIEFKQRLAADHPCGWSVHLQE